MEKIINTKQGYTQKQKMRIVGLCLLVNIVMFYEYMIICRGIMDLNAFIAVIAAFAPVLIAALLVIKLWNLFWHSDSTQEFNMHLHAMAALWWWIAILFANITFLVGFKDFKERWLSELVLLATSFFCAYYLMLRKNEDISKLRLRYIMM